MLEQCRDVFGRLWPAEEIALYGVAALGAQEAQLLACLDSFGNDL